jgi:CheY-like chemotaxis protein
MDYLYRRGKYAELSGQLLPGLILLDLNMPKKDGREALREIKADPNLRRIPIVVLTTSREEDDITGSYDMGVSGFVIKPVTFESLREMIKGLTKYWFEIVELPPQRTGG